MKNTICALKIQLVGAKKPPVWRKIHIPIRLTFYEFHLVIQEAMSWFDYHLFQFDFDEYIVPGSVDMDSIPWREKSVLNPFTTIVFPYLLMFEKMDYYYDFGDGWHIKITMEDFVESEEYAPKIIAYKGISPPEDCGGIGGYYNLLQILNDPTHEEYEMMTDWAEMQSFNTFDKEETNLYFEEIFSDFGQIFKSYSHCTRFLRGNGRI